MPGMGNGGSASSNNNVGRGVTLNETIPESGPRPERCITGPEH